MKVHESGKTEWVTCNRHVQVSTLGAALCLQSVSVSGTVLGTLTRDQVERLIPHLQAWVETGSLKFLECESV